MLKKYLLYFFLFLLVTTGEAQQKIPLNQLNLKLMTTGFGQVRADRSCDNNPITLCGKVYKGVGTHAPSKMIIVLQGKAKRFTTYMGVDDEATAKGSVQFKITGDGKVLFKSPLMHKGDKPQKADLRLKNVDTLILEALPGPDGNNNDHADWAEAIFEMNEGTPIAVPDCQLITISTDNTQVTLCIDKQGNLYQQYLGTKGGLETVFHHGEQKIQAYPTIQSNSQFSYWGEPALHVIHADGHMSTQLKIIGHETNKIDNNVTFTRLRLKDPLYPFFTDLCYKAYAQQNVIEQWAEIYHQENAPVLIKQSASSALSFQANSYWLTQFTGNWAEEFHIDEYPLTTGEKIIESRRGITSSHGQQQHFMITFDQKPSETQGEVLAGTLAWSGNYRLNFEVAPSGELTVLTGMNPWSSDYSLQPGKRLVTPALIYTYGKHGKGEVSRNLHRWALAYGVRDGQKPLRTIFNNWEATGMNTADQVIIPFLKPARDLGFELFLLDDGWFGLENQARVLGEWQPTPLMHPQGMKTIINAAQKTGIDFGLWVEMEMANPSARLLKTHPEWLLCEPQRTPYLQRGQYVLDLTNPEVQDFCIQSFHQILIDNPGITFVKWDCNSGFHNPYSHYLGKNQQHLWYEYTQGLYRVFNETAKQHPDLEMMLCSAGGARNDYGSLRYFHEFWTSDNTTPLSRVYIQWGCSHIFPAKVQGAHVTHMGNQPFKFAFDVAMSGCLGMDANPVKLSEKDQAITRRAVEVYKNKLRPIVQQGDMYRLLSPYANSRAVVSFVEPNTQTKAAVFVYQVKDDSEGITVTLQGLNPKRQYKIEEVNIDSPEIAACKQNGETISGKDLMNKGLYFNCKKQLDSAVVYLTTEN